MTEDPPLYEIDPGSPTAATPSQPPAEVMSAEELEAERLLHASRQVAVDHLRAVPGIKFRIDIEGLIMAGLCGQGLSAIGRIDTWSTGIVVGLITALASFIGAGYFWKRTRLFAEHLEALPLPLDGNPPSRLGALDATQRAASRHRRGEELARIEDLAHDLARYRPRLRAACRGAFLGTICGWLTGIIGPGVVGVLAASAAGGVGAVGGWLASGTPWPPQRMVQVFAGVMPVVAVAMALLCDATPWAAIGGWAIAVATGLCWRGRVIDLVTGSSALQHPADRAFDPQSDDHQPASK
jgi:hypothetical protein